jgi:pyruvate decarboxylase
MGKTAISESNPRFGGVYVGSISHPEIKEKVESASLILSIGGLQSDFNTGNFTYQIPTNRTIELHSDQTKIQHARYPGIGMKHMLPKLTAALEEFKEGAKEIGVPVYKNVVPTPSGSLIEHSWFWPRVGAFFRPKDVVLGETGTSSFGLVDIPFPEKAVFVSQILWGSIGWTVGATLGAALAARERQLGRTILFIGDGSIQLTVQELTPMIRHGLTPIVFVLNNKGYTIERYLHGKTRKYNDITNW